MNKEERRNRLLAMHCMGSSYQGGTLVPDVEAVSVSGEIVTFNTNLERPLKSLIVHFSPIQEGSGTPSPDNIRPISGRTGVNVKQNAVYADPALRNYPITWEDEGTIYGGYVDAVNGKLVAEWELKKIKDIKTWSKYDVTQGTLFRSETLPVNIPYNNTDSFIASAYRTVKANNRTDGTISCGSINRIDIIDDRFSSSENFVSIMGDETIAYKLAAPIEYNIDPVEINTLLGNNAIWSDAETFIDLEYWRAR